MLLTYSCSAAVQIAVLVACAATPQRQGIDLHGHEKPGAIVEAMYSDDEEPELTATRVSGWVVLGEHLERVEDGNSYIRSILFYRERPLPPLVCYLNAPRDPEYLLEMPSECWNLPGFDYRIEGDLFSNSDSDSRLLKSSHAVDAVVRLGRGEIHGALTQASLNRGMRRRMGSFKQCYERALEGSSELSGRVKLKFIVRGDGQVPAAVVASSSVDDRPLERCLAKAVKSASFAPIPDSGIAIVFVPLDLTSRESRGSRR